MDGKIMDWSKYPNFNKAEFDCKHSGKNDMKPEFMSKLQALRSEYGKPMKISSGYRDVTHPIEKVKAAPGEHTLGMACDVAVEGADAYRIIQLGIKHGFTRIGVQQKGAGRFIHLGLAAGRFPAPMVWSY